jgi:hypothetical protein
MSDIPTTHSTTTSKLAATAVDTLPSAVPGAPFATVPAAQLRVGDLIHRPAPDGGHVYVLVAQAVFVDGLDPAGQFAVEIVVVGRGVSGVVPVVGV